MDKSERAVLSADTSRAAEDLQVQRWREMPPEEKVRLGRRGRRLILDLP